MVNSLCDTILLLGIRHGLLYKDATASVDELDQDVFSSVATSTSFGVKSHLVLNKVKRAL